MKKSSLFISALLFTFIIAIVAGAITAYRSSAASIPSTDIQASTAIPTPTQVVIDAQQAAQIAADYIKENDLYSVTSTTLDGTSVYMVTFSSGTVVYVSLTGEVVQVIPPPVTIFTDSTTGSSVPAHRSSPLVPSPRT